MLVIYNPVSVYYENIKYTTEPIYVVLPTVIAYVSQTKGLTGHTKWNKLWNRNNTYL